MGQYATSMANSFGSSPLVRFTSRHKRLPANWVVLANKAVNAGGPMATTLGVCRRGRYALPVRPMV